MNETIEQAESTDHEIKVSERNEHSQEPGSFHRNKRVIFIAAALLTLCLAAAVIYRAEEGRHSVAPHAETPSASEAMPPDVAVATDEQMRQIAVEPVTERTLDVERETTGN